MSDPPAAGGRRGLALAIVENLAPLIAFIALDNLVGLKAAIVGAIVIAVLDGLRRLVFRIAYNRLILLATLTTIAFGLIDLFAATPFMLQYEAVLSAAVVAGACIASTFGRKSLIEMLSERGHSSGFAGRPDLHRFFTILTLGWAGYFLLSAGFYLYLALTTPLDQAMTIRAVWTVATLGAMIAANALLGRRLFRVLKRRGWLG